MHEVAIVIAYTYLLYEKMKRMYILVLVLELDLQTLELSISRV